MTRLTTVERVYEAMASPDDVTVSQLLRLIDDYSDAMINGWNLDTQTIAPPVEQACVISVIRAIVMETRTGLQQNHSTCPIGPEVTYLLDTYRRPAK